MKTPKEYDVAEVAMWLHSIGLGDKVDPFKENAIDGDMLVALTHEDLTGDLGLSNLQAKKVERTLAKTSSDGGGSSEELKALSDENAALKKENAQLRAKLQPAAPAPAPAPAAAPPKQKNQHEVVKGAAGGAARGAVMGAVAGAICGDAGKGAKVGAAMGATGGAMNGLGARRRRRMMR